MKNIIGYIGFLSMGVCGIYATYFRFSNPDMTEVQVFNSMSGLYWLIVLVSFLASILVWRKR